MVGTSNSILMYSKDDDNPRAWGCAGGLVRDK